MKYIDAISRTAVAGAALFALSTASAQTDPKIGVNATVRNSVQTKSVSEPALHPAIVRAPVHIGELVVSGDKSSLQILLIDHSVFTVGANARMTIDKFVYDPNRESSDIAASIVKGAFRFMSGPTLSNAGHNAISSPVATIGVRGTIVEGAVGPDALAILAGQAGIPPFNGNTDSATLIVLRGPGRDGEGFDKPGAVDVTSGGVVVSIEHPGQAVIVWGPDQPPFGPFDLSDHAFDLLSALLRTKPGSGGPGSAGEFGDVGSAGNNSGDNLDVGRIGDSFTTDTTAIDLPPGELPSND